MIQYVRVDASLNCYLNQINWKIHNFPWKFRKFPKSKIVYMYIHVYTSIMTRTYCLQKIIMYWNTCIVIEISSASQAPDDMTSPFFSFFICFFAVILSWIFVILIYTYLSIFYHMEMDLYFNKNKILNWKHIDRNMDVTHWLVLENEGWDKFVSIL